MRILHTYCLNYNIGDYALGIGVKNLLRNFLEVDCIGETNLQGTVFHKYYINEVINKKYDLLVIGGGGIIHGPHWPSGWFWLIEKELIKTIKIPFIVYGVGYNYFKGETGIPERGILHLKETVANAAYFSVRNDGSFERLKEQTGIVVPEIPDPGFHVGLNTEYMRPVKEKYVLVQLANDKPEYRFRGEENRNRFISEMRSILKDISLKYKIILAPHVLEDITLSKKVSEDISNCEVWDFGYFAFDHSYQAIAYYKYAEFVLAMRGHGQIVPISFNTPVISLENHQKNRGLMEKLNLIDYNVDILDDDFELRTRTIIRNIEEKKNNLVKQYEKINKKLMSDSTKAFDAIEKALNNGR
jgi:polysaccharide pyruvyl transferase WcaK-like protein